MSQTELDSLTEDGFDVLIPTRWGHVLLYILYILLRPHYALYFLTIAEGHAPNNRGGLDSPETRLSSLKKKYTFDLITVSSTVQPRGFAVLEQVFLVMSGFIRVLDTTTMSIFS